MGQGCGPFPKSHLVLTRLPNSVSSSVLLYRIHVDIWCWEQCGYNPKGKLALKIVKIKTLGEIEIASKRVISLWLKTFDDCTCIVLKEKLPQAFM